MQQTSCPCRKWEQVVVSQKVNITNDRHEAISNRLYTLCSVNCDPSVRGIDCIKPQSITNFGTLINHQSLLVLCWLSVTIVQPVAVGLLTRTCPLFTVTVFSSRYFIDDPIVVGFDSELTFWIKFCMLRAWFTSPLRDNEIKWSLEHGSNKGKRSKRSRFSVTWTWFVHHSNLLGILELDTVSYSF